MRRWTVPVMIAAVRAEAQRLGRVFKADDLRLSDGRCPSPQTVRATVGSINDLQRLAGFTPTRSRGDGRRKRVQPL